MAGEKTEAPTPRRQEDARKRGQVAHSREMDSAIVLLAILGIFKFAGPYMWGSLEAITVDTWAHLGRNPLTVDLTAAVGVSLLGRSILVLLPLMAAVLLIGVLGGMAQTGGPLFATQALKPQFKRLNPLEGGKRLVASRQAYVNLVKAVFKFTVLGLVGYLTFRGHWEAISTLGMQAGIQDSIAILVAVGFDLSLRVALVVLALAVADFVFQRRDMTRQLRMSLQEVKDEAKQTDGDPQMKGQMARQRQKLLARVMQSVPKADVVLVNPTHYAVALKYDPTSSHAPVVLAKGTDLVALRMRGVAEEHGIPVIQNPPLCRAVFRATRTGQEIPADLYEAVAEVLAFVYRLRTLGRALQATA
ncbi:MAG: EscU/YscU/HrcU family type III secretion system export apparatus switch protein [Dehalococcoidia bacterium]|nr:EscU/YscU/HrcU family type III secretion system export apparatus switch protein [Dehalococcoidia bacterium]